MDIPPEPEVSPEEADPDEHSRNPQRLYRRRLETSLQTLRINFAKYSNNDDIANNVALLETLTRAAASMKAYLVDIPPQPEAPPEEADADERSRNPLRLHRRRLETSLWTLRSNFAKYSNNDDIANNAAFLVTLTRATANMKAFLHCRDHNTD